MSEFNNIKNDWMDVPVTGMVIDNIDFSKLTVPNIDTIYPSMLTSGIVNIQPLSSPSGNMVFAMRTLYGTGAICQICGEKYNVLGDCIIACDGCMAKSMHDSKLAKKIRILEGLQNI